MSGLPSYYIESYILAWGSVTKILKASDRGQATLRRKQDRLVLVWGPDSKFISLRGCVRGNPCLRNTLPGAENFPHYSSTKPGTCPLYSTQFRECHNPQADSSLVRLGWRQTLCRKLLGHRLAQCLRGPQPSRAIAERCRRGSIDDKGENNEVKRNACGKSNTIGTNPKPRYI